jgi:hypothetical protein
MSAFLVYFTGDVGFLLNRIVEDDLSLCVFLPAMHYFYQVSRNVLVKLISKLWFNSSAISSFAVHLLRRTSSSSLNLFNGENNRQVLTINDHPVTALDYYYSCLSSLFLPVFSFITAETLLYNSFKHLKPFHRHLIGGAVFVLCKDVFYYTYKFRKFLVNKSRRIINNEE